MTQALKLPNTLSSLREIGECNDFPRTLNSPSKLDFPFYRRLSANSPGCSFRYKRSCDYSLLQFSCRASPHRSKTEERSYHPLHDLDKESHLYLNIRRAIKYTIGTITTPNSVPTKRQPNGVIPNNAIPMPIRTLPSGGCVHSYTLR